MNWLPEILPPASPDVTQIDATLRERWINAESMRRAHRRTTNSTTSPDPQDDAVHDSLDRAFRVACMEVTMWRGIRPNSDGPSPAVEPISRPVVWGRFLHLVSRQGKHLHELFQRPDQVTLRMAKLIATMCQVRLAVSARWVAYV